jgi:hypothetical protein
MSMMIESTEELLVLLKKTDLKVHSVDELRQLLATINANYNPEAARQKTGKLIGVAVPGIMAGAAAFGTFFLLGAAAGNSRLEFTSYTVGCLSVIWGAVAFVSTPAVIAGAIMSSIRRGRPTPDNPYDRPVSRSAPVVTHITRELPS